MKDRILLWNDDNHAPCVWINNKFAGVDLDRVIKNALYAQPISKEGFYEILYIYPWDFEDEFNDDDFDKLFYWFQTMPKFTEEQWNLIFKKQWKELFKTL